MLAADILRRLRPRRQSVVGDWLDEGRGRAGRGQKTEVDENAWCERGTFLGSELTQERRGGAVGCEGRWRRGWSVS